MGTDELVDQRIRLIASRLPRHSLALYVGGADAARGFGELSDMPLQDGCRVAVTRRGFVVYEVRDFMDVYGKPQVTWAQVAARLAVWFAPLDRQLRAADGERTRLVGALRVATDAASDAFMHGTEDSRTTQEAANAAYGALMHYERDDLIPLIAQAIAQAPATSVQDSLFELTATA
jgi:hypothetical protein